MRDLGAVWRPCVDLRTLSCVNVCLCVCASLVSVCECVISVWVGGRASSSGLVDVGADSWPCVEFTDRLMWGAESWSSVELRTLSLSCVNVCVHVCGGSSTARECEGLPPTGGRMMERATTL